MGRSDVQAIHAAFSNDGTPQPKSESARLLHSLLERSRLQLKLARPIHRRGLFHEKLGIFTDERTGDFVVFAGSLNESRSALVDNYEHVEVYRSWRAEDQLRALEKLSYFQALWTGLVHRLEIEPVQRALSWISEVDDEPRPPKSEDTGAPKAGKGMQDLSDKPQVPPGLSLRPYQVQAISKWLNAGMRGVFKMATGSGKTITALTATTLLANRSAQLLVVVVCPYTHLVEQWVGVARTFGYRPVACFGGKSKWRADAIRQVQQLNRGTRKCAFLAVTQSTFASSTFQDVLRASESPFLMTADEVHGMGTEFLAEVLKTGRVPDYRIGLSATPERWFDERGTERIREYFGDTVVELTLADALKSGALVPYYYFPVLVELDSDEGDRYRALTASIAKHWHGTDSLPDEGPVKHLLIQRARLLASAGAKLPALRQLLGEQRQRGGVTQTLIYCGDGRVETDEESSSEDERRQVAVVSDLLNFDLHLPCGIYVAETPLERRMTMQTELATGDIAAIVAIRCLDEGVDIPSVRTAYILASSTNPRQFIQRRGRILRTDPASGKESASIYDFVVVPPEDPDNQVNWAIERGLLRRELRRVFEFSRHAVNEGRTLELLRPLRERYHLYALEDE